MIVYLLVVFVIATFVGYILIKNVPSLLHTPLMSGMNALSGLTLLATVTATSAAVLAGSKILGVLGIVVATINIVAGFGLTHRMLGMFHQQDLPTSHNSKDQSGESR